MDDINLEQLYDELFEPRNIIAISEMAKILKL